MVPFAQKAFSYAKQNWTGFIVFAFLLWAIYSAFMAQLNYVEPGEIVREAMALEQKRVDIQLKETKSRSEDLDKELQALQFEIETLRGEIAGSVEKREELHDAIGKARSIRDIDRILKRGSRGR